MESIVEYFKKITSSHRSAILVGGIAFFWMLESAIPLVRFSYKKWRHAGINIFFTLTTIVINFTLAFLLLKTADWTVANMSRWKSGRAPNFSKFRTTSDNWLTRFLMSCVTKA